MRSLVSMLTVVALSVCHASGVVKNVTARQIQPWRGLVEIQYELTEDVVLHSDATVPELSVICEDQEHNVSFRVTKFTTEPTFERGVHKVVWDMGAEGVALVSRSAVFHVSVVEVAAPYCVVDLSDGRSATHWDVTYMKKEPTEGWKDEYKTTKLVLKNVTPWAFTMGCEKESDLFGAANAPHRVTLTSPFYIGIFEVTQSQYESVTGKNPSRYQGEKCPVENVCYNDIRGGVLGSGWPANNAVDATSFMGEMRARTGLDFDLPTEAQWEYACRAGSETMFAYGDQPDGAYMWYSDNSRNTTHDVGTRISNEWGLYDMHGNVREWCLDWVSGALKDGTDPKGPQSGYYRVMRGGDFSDDSGICSSSHREYCDANSPCCNAWIEGFRVALTLSFSGEVFGEALTSAISIDAKTKFQTIGTILNVECSPNFAAGCEGGLVRVLLDDKVIVEAGESCVHELKLEERGVYTLTHQIVIGGNVCNERVSYCAVSDDGGVTVPSSWTAIPADAFRDCAGLVSVIIPNSVKTVAPTAFKGCTNISAVTIDVGWGGMLEALDGWIDESDGVYRSIPVEDGQSTEMRAKIGIVGNDGFDFQWKVSSEANWDFLSYSVDGEGTEQRISGEIGWQDVSLKLPNGVHEIVWKYEKDGGGYRGEDCGWIRLPRNVVGYKYVMADLFPDALGSIRFVQIENGQALTSGFMSGCKSLKKVSLPVHLLEAALAESKESIEEVIITGDCEEIAPGLFVGCSSLKKIVLPDSVERIGAGAFEGCVALEYVNLPSSLSEFRLVDIPLKVRESWGLSYDENGFMIHSGLLLDYMHKDATEVVVPDDVVRIGDGVFSDCVMLKTLRLPAGLIDIADNVFADCSSLESVSLPGSLAEKEMSDVFPSSYDKIRSIVICEDATKIGDRAFAGCKSLKTIILPERMMSIGARAFSGCDSLTEVVLPNSVTRIGDAAFSGCASLSHVAFPGSVEWCDERWVFNSCPVLTAITITGVVKPLAGLFEAYSYPDGGYIVYLHKLIRELSFDSVAFGENEDDPGRLVIPECYDIERLVISGKAENYYCSTARWRDFFGAMAASVKILYNDELMSKEGEDGRLQWSLDSRFERAGDYVMQIVGYDDHDMPLPRRIELIHRIEGPDVGILPEDKTVFETAQRVSITSSWENAVIHYTVDGSEPTDQSPVFSKFNVTKKTTVKAIAVADGYPWSKTAVAQYGKGKTETPVVTASAGGTYFYSAGNVITMTCSTEGAEIRYTTDGSDPCESSTLYKGPFAITDTTRFRVIACGHLEFVDSPIVEKTFERVWSTVSAPTVSVGSADEGRANEVTITCPTAQATIHYTIDGSDPTVESPVYEGTFLLLEGATIKAVAMRDDWKDSPVAERVVAKTWVSGSAVGVDNTFTFASAVPWTIDTAVYRDGGSSLRSGEIANGSSTKMVTTVEGDGFVRFWWKASCENDPDYDNWDHACFYVDGEECARIDGMTDWSEVTVQLAGAGRHALSWVYVKDESATAGDDCVWIDSMAFSPSVTLTFVGKDATSGVAPSAVTSYGGASVALPLPATLLRTGYVFAGWAYGGEIYAAGRTFVVPNGNVTFESCWEPIAYDVVFDANGGSGEMSDARVAYDECFALPECGYVRDGYEFEGWADVADGVVLYRPGDQVKNRSCENGAKVMLYAVWSVSIVENPVIDPGDGSSFAGPSCEVSISCATEGAAIYYSAKGTTPRQTDAYKYTAPFVINDTATIKAIAVKGDRKSEYVTATITKKTLTLADAVNAPSLTFTTGGVSPWEPIVDSSAAVGTEAARSGAMGPSETADGNMSWMEVSVVGAGTLSFSWKVDCEWDESGACTWDRLMYFVDGADKDEDRIDGFTDWDSKSVTFTSGGTHTVRWVYFKDDYDEEDATCEDCGWVDGVVWSPLAVLEPIPELPSSASADEVRVALEGSADAKLQENITDATVYGQYREWAMKIGAETVKGAANSWISFAVDSASLLEKVPEDSDLKIEEFKPAVAEGAFDFTVSVKDVTVGSGATDANLKKVFGLGGTTQLGVEDFDPDKVALEFGTPINGKLKFTASPKDKTAKSFFMKMKVR